MKSKFQNLFNKYYVFISNSNVVKFVVVQLVIIILLSLVTKVIFYHFSIKMGNYLPNVPYIYYPARIKYFVLFFLIPFLEVFIFQVLPYKILSNFSILQNNKFSIVIISSLLFALSNSNSLAYFIYAFLIGILLMVSYQSRLEKGDSFPIVLLLHILFIITAFLGKFIPHG